MSKCKFQGERIGYIHVRCASKDAADAVLLVSMMMLSLLSLKCLACISKPASRVPCLQWCFNCFRVSTPEIEVVADEDHRASGKALEPEKLVRRPSDRRCTRSRTEGDLWTRCWRGGVATCWFYFAPRPVWPHLAFLR